MSRPWTIAYRLQLSHEIFGREPAPSKRCVECSAVPQQSWHSHTSLALPGEQPDQGVVGSQDASGNESRLLGRTHIFEGAGVGSWVHRSDVSSSDTSIFTWPLGNAPDFCCACSCLLTFEKACSVSFAITTHAANILTIHTNAIEPTALSATDITLNFSAVSPLLWSLE